MGNIKHKPCADDPGPSIKSYNDEQKAKARREKTRLKVQAWRKKTEKTFMGTRKLHAVKSVDKDCQLEIRNLSCYCDQCVKGRGMFDCKKVVQDWEVRKLTFVNDSPNPKLISKKKETTTQEPPKKRKSTETETTKSKKRKVHDQSLPEIDKATDIPKYNSGDFVVVGLKPKKGPLCVYMAEVIGLIDTEIRLKYMKKSGDVYIWPEKEDFSQEPIDQILCRLQAPEIVNERGHFKFRAKDLCMAEAALGKKYKYFYLK